MFQLKDSWVWDFWFADDGTRYHLFFLYASKALHDPEDRHYRASVGHAVSSDLREWTRIEDALVRGDEGDFDDLATWTGSVVRDDGLWYMFYTGSRLAPDGKNVQRIGYATSRDLISWTKSPTNPVLEASSTSYEKIDDADWHDEAFRDPWVFRDPSGRGWHMYITARAREGDPATRGVVGHAVSPDLRRWELRAPVTQPAQHGFGQLEVLQVELVDGKPVLLFSCLADHLSAERRAHLVGGGGIWAAPAQSVLGPFDIENAYQLTDDRFYVGRLLRDRDTGAWRLFAFHHTGASGEFVGGITDPMDVAWRGERLTLVDHGESEVA
jgi:beta-fructofuranosidase